jgi:predicted nucleic-acid-binding protein
MIALDTNVLARYLLNDDPKQASAVAALLRRQETFTAPITVMLELAWVLQVNDCPREEVAKGLRALLGLPNVQRAGAVVTIESKQRLAARKQLGKLVRDLRRAAR